MADLIWSLPSCCLPPEKVDNVIADVPRGSNAKVTFIADLTHTPLTKWPPFRRRHFQVHFYKWKVFLIQISLKFVPKQNSDKLEKLQERALRFVFSDYTSPYSDLLKHGNFLSLSALRISYLAIEMYKCVYGINPPYLNELFIGKDTRYNLRGSNLLQQPEFETVRYGFKSFRLRLPYSLRFRYYGSKLWNALPTQLNASENLHHFKKNITQWCLSGKCDVFIIQWYA